MKRFIFSVILSLCISNSCQRNVKVIEITECPDEKDLWDMSIALKDGYADVTFDAQRDITFEFKAFAQSYNLDNDQDEGTAMNGVMNLINQYIFPGYSRLKQTCDPPIEDDEVVFQGLYTCKQFYGEKEDLGGIPITDGNHMITFKLFDKDNKTVFCQDVHIEVTAV